jgi:hypothetical protein
MHDLVSSILEMVLYLLHPARHEKFELKKTGKRHDDEKYSSSIMNKISQIIEQCYNHITLA